MNNSSSFAPERGRREGMREELASLHERARAARQAAEDVRDESRELVARCVDGRIKRENDREAWRVSRCGIGQALARLHRVP